MAKRKTARRKSRARAPFRPLRWLLVWGLRVSVFTLSVVLAVVVFHSVMAPPKTIYMRQEAARLGDITRGWTDLEDVAPIMARSVVAAEDANFCLHWGFDMRAIRAAIDEGAARGASTISQQTVKNVYLWHGRNWARKALEAMLTPVVEMVWPKRRIVEVYLNVAEFDEGVFGIGAAAPHYFGVRADQLTADQAARLAAVLPNPKGRSASNPSAWLRQRAADIRDGAATIARDGRAACFED
jgi:monofunctional biosynthetic peptidoglycan transglycosylase